MVFDNMKLRSKFFIAILLLSILPLLLFTIFSYNRYTELIHTRMNEFSDNLFENAVSATNVTLNSVTNSIGYITFYNDDTDSVINTLRSFGENREYDSYDVWNANQYFSSAFRNILFSNDKIEGIYLFSASGESFFCTNSSKAQLLPNYNAANDSWYKETLALDGSYFISTETPQGMFLDNIDYIYIAKTISDVYTHKFLGVIMVACDNTLLDLSNMNSMPSVTKLTISNPLNHKILYSSSTDFEEDESITEKRVDTAALDLQPLILTATFDYKSLFNELNIMGYLFFAIAAILSVLLLFIAYFMSGDMIRPIESLSYKMAHQAENDFIFDSPYMNRTDEIGVMYNEYANMLEKLEISIKKDYKDKLILLDAQMKSLEARINSHFLFNTLESINSMAEIDDNEQIATMSLALGNMFRYSIKTQSELVPLSSELKHVDDYVSIQRIRFSNRFILVKDIPDKLLDVSVLKLILQPLVENALYHGIDYCSKGDKITITAKEIGNNLLIQVVDNGQGMNQSTLDTLNEKLQTEASFTELGHRTKQSIGLKNIHSRIELYYGKGYGLSIESKLHYGTSVSIKLPLLKE